MRLRLEFDRGHVIVAGVGILAKGHKSINFLFFKGGNASLGFKRLAIVHQMVERFGDMSCQTRLDSQIGAAGANKERKGLRMNDTVVVIERPRPVSGR
jgi:hypothetical protein